MRGFGILSAVSSDDIKIIARNRKATFDYHVDETLEVGLVLRGTEVKSLRDGKCQLADAYAALEGGEVFVHQLHISEYKNGTIYNHDPKRVRKLLLHRDEISRLHRKVQQKGVTLIPLEVYFKGGRAKVKLGLCRGKKAHDKRASIKEKDLQREARYRD